MLSSGVDLLRRRAPQDPNSFSEYTRSRYGDTLYRLFFKPYTEKFLRIPCEDVHVDWAKTGINRAVIDNRIKSESLVDLVRNVLLPRAVVTEFIYPSYGGFGTFCEKLAAEVTRRKGSIRLETTVEKLESRGRRLAQVELSDGTRLEPEQLIWSGNLLDLARLLGQPPPALRYLATVLLNMEIHGDVLEEQQWIYYGSTDTVLSRVTVTKELAPYMSPAGETGLCVEVTCREGDETWKTPEALISQIQSDLVRVRLVRSLDDFGRTHVERVRDTYPIYDLRYKESFAAAARMAKAFDNLKLLGRTGAYWYNNSDHSMKMSLNLSRHLLRGGVMEDKEAFFPV
jgi:protoporphyrinogen oxidase